MCMWAPSSRLSPLEQPFHSTFRSFRSMSPADGYPIRSLSFSPTGSHFVVATASAKPQVSRDAEGTIVVFKVSPCGTPMDPAGV